MQSLFTYFAIILIIWGGEKIYSYNNNFFNLNLPLFQQPMPRIAPTGPWSNSIKTKTIDTTQDYQIII